ncbi:DUF1538 domain-containing protein [Caldicoprobacter faecalis]|uniref:DUF1538 domain-containing protein n=1 Tax=Caldicoprobacter faecalis TaxID=937334 RepID=A0A1I5YNG8_9FIRM|nr:DUF1538 domain-containing protein [Caldicoprobacter faecalis]SFQ45585.1 Protein of unknown function [Caldicoprobacter faecalis]
MNVILDKLKEVLHTVLPITAIVLILHFTLTPLETHLILKFLVGTLLIIIGLSVFLLGVDVGITPIGTAIGSAIIKTNKILVVISVGFVLGFFISAAEPDLHILARQVDMVTSGQVSKMGIVVAVSIGLGIMIALGFARIVYNVSLRTVFTVMYGIVFILALFSSPAFLAISFDACGAATGALAVPFILALAMGVSMPKKDSKASERDSFGLVCIAAIGAILGVLIMDIASNAGEITGALEANALASESIIDPFIEELPKVTRDVFLALLPILLTLFIFQIFSSGFSRRAFRKVLMGLLFAFVGLVLFMDGVNAGFMDVGSIVGYRVAMLDNKAYILIIGFILGFVTVLAEPAVHVLMHQIEDATSGYIKRSLVMVALSLGIGVAVALSVLRILVPGIQLWHYLLPSYIIAIALMYFVPELFIGIAFDSGSVASGPMTATFMLAFIQGAAEAVEGANVLVDGFGMIAMVASMPLIALQILGLVYKVKSRKEA